MESSYDTRLHVTLASHPINLLYTEVVRSEKERADLYIPPSILKKERRKEIIVSMHLLQSVLDVFRKDAW